MGAKADLRTANGMLHHDGTKCDGSYLPALVAQARLGGRVPGTLPPGQAVIVIQTAGLVGRGTQIGSLVPARADCETLAVVQA